MHQQELKTPGRKSWTAAASFIRGGPPGLCRYTAGPISRPLPLRIKEWDFYQVSDREKCLQFTFGHASYAGQAGIMLFDFRNGKMIADINKIIPFPFGRLYLPESAETDSDIAYDKQGVHLRFKTERAAHAFSLFLRPILKPTSRWNAPCHFLPSFRRHFGNRPHVYYNQKINCMTARGRAVYKGRGTHSAKTHFGLLDWAAGVALSQ